ncbi:hypothetical protein N9449_00730 [Oceanospirillaceae bacterium]|mgnify:CR=1 FL=1|jgi:hypothetical protein|nr:hypothetical protein [Oceanospirillaceae bacterium]
MNMPMNMPMNSAVTSEETNRIRMRNRLLVALDENLEHKDARLIDAKFVYDDEMVVMAEWRNEFVTWKFSESGCYYGNYYSDSRAARMDFIAR